MTAVPTTAPADARRAALEWVTHAAAAASDRWFVVPPVAGEPPVVVVPEPARAALLAALHDPAAPELLRLVVPAAHGWPEDGGPLRTGSPAAPHLHSAVLRVQPATAAWPAPDLYSSGCAVEVELWVPRGDRLVAPRPNPWATTVHREEALAVTAVDAVKVRTAPLMTGVHVEARAFPVDAVLTWVDGRDPAWRARRDRRLRDLGSGGPPPSVEAVGAGRYTSRDELRFAMRSLHLFAPWVRRIHLVTDRQLPGWLDPTHPRVSVVDHAELLDARHLPTFNSHAIETALHRVPGLAEHFVYLNDDTMLGRPLTPDRFFGPAGQVAVFLAEEPVGVDAEDAPPHLRAAMNNRRLLARDHDRVLTRTLLHAPTPLRRSLLDEVERRYAEELERTAASPFRSPTDVSVTSSLAQHVALLTGAGQAAALRAQLLPLRAPDIAARMRRALGSRGHDALCLGDYHEHALRPRHLDRLVQRFLEEYFPVPAPWELPGDGAPPAGGGLS